MDVEMNSTAASSSKLDPESLAAATPTPLSAVEAANVSPSIVAAMQADGSTDLPADDDQLLQAAAQVDGSTDVPIVPGTNHVAPHTPVRPIVALETGSTLGSSGKKAKALKSSKETKERKAGKADDARSFEKLWENSESELVGYMTYEFRQDFRRLAMSAYTLKAYAAAYADRNKKQARQNYVLSYIRDYPSQMLENGDPCKIYPEQSDGAHVVPRVALACCQMRRAIEKAVSGSPPYTQQDQDDAQDEYFRLIGRRAPKFTIDKLVFKSVGPFEKYGECDLEAVNRCFNMLSYASHVTINSYWDVRFVTEKWDDEVSILASHLPRWLRGDQESMIDTSPAAPVKDSIGQTLRAARPVTVTWNYASRAPFAKEFREYLSEEGLDSDLVFKVQLQLQPNASRAEFLDQVRSRFKMDIIDAQIKGLQITELAVNVLDEDWEKTLESIWQTDEETSFSMWLRQRDDGEVLWEN